MSLLHPLPELHLLLCGIHLYLWDTSIPSNPVLFAEFTCKGTKHKDTMIALHDPNLLKLAHESIDTTLLQPPGPYFFCEKAKITFFFLFLWNDKNLLQISKWIFWFFKSGKASLELMWYLRCDLFPHLSVKHRLLENVQGSKQTWPGS